MSDVKAFRIVSGEEVVATVSNYEAVSSDCYILEKPRALMLQQGPDGTVGVAMLPFMASANNPDFDSESDVMLYKKDIVAEVVDVPDVLEKAYLQQTSRIALVN